MQQPELETYTHITISLSPDQYAHIQRIVPKEHYRSPSPSANMAGDSHTLVGARFYMIG